MINPKIEETDMKELRRLYEEIVGYDPVADDASITAEQMAETLNYFIERRQR